MRAEKCRFQPARLSAGSAASASATAPRGMREAATRSAPVWKMVRYSVFCRRRRVRVRHNAQQGVLARAGYRYVSRVRVECAARLEMRPAHAGAPEGSAGHEPREERQSGARRRRREAAVRRFAVRRSACRPAATSAAAHARPPAAAQSRHAKCARRAQKTAEGERENAIQEKAR